jgi:hypothetical protein
VAATGEEQPDAAAYGIALLSRRPVSAWQIVRLGSPPVKVPMRFRGSRRPQLVGDEPRVAVVATVQESGAAMTVVNTHLSFVRWWGGVQLRRLMRAVEGTEPLVLVGDLNMLPARVQAARHRDDVPGERPARAARPPAGPRAGRGGRRRGRAGAAAVRSPGAVRGPGLRAGVAHEQVEERGDRQRAEQDREHRAGGPHERDRRRVREPGPDAREAEQPAHPDGEPVAQRQMTEHVSHPLRTAATHGNGDDGRP